MAAEGDAVGRSEGELHTGVAATTGEEVEGERQGGIETEKGVVVRVVDAFGEVYV